MKKNRTGILVLILSVASALVIQSCKRSDPEPPKPPTPPVSITLPESITLSNDGESSQIELSLSDPSDWSVTLSDPAAQWCNLVTSSGKGSGHLVITAAANENRTARQVNVVVTSGLTTASVTIYQRDTLGVDSQDHLIVSNQGSDIVIPVEANTMWEVRPADPRTYWVGISPDHGTKAQSITLSIEPNQYITERSAEIVFIAGNATRVIQILQQNIPQATYQTDSLALVALYNATDGKGWTNPWNLKLPIANWKGVKLEMVEDQMRVTELRLPSRGLDGEVPLDLGNLLCLKTLDLSYNAIKGDLPSEVGNLTQLEELNLSNNKFVGSISLTITKLAKLKRLDLQQNRFSIFPVEICQLQELEYLHLANNELTDLPGEISQMSNLKSLYLDNNQLTALPAGLDKAPKLEYLHAAFNQIEGQLPQAIADMPNLVSLRLEHNKLTGPIPADYSRLTKLKYIYMGNNELSGNLPDMSAMTVLETLDIAENKLSGAIPEFGRGGLLASLQHVFLSNNELTGELTEDLRNLTRLIDLYIDNNRLTGTLPADALGAMTNKYPGNPSWESLLYLPKLVALVLNDNYLTGSIPTGLANRLESYSPAFNKSGFRLNNNNLNGPVPKAFHGAYGSLPDNYKFAANVYPQRNGVTLTLEAQ